jgi:carbonic anhydrase
MVKRFAAIIVLLATSLLMQAQEHHSLHWGYEGEGGPDHWGDLSPEFGECKTGHQQSPIDIRKTIPSDLPAIKFGYQPSPLKIIDNGHTVQVNYAPGSWITVGDKRYQLLQFHFHHPSEEEIDGKPHAMVAHLVHSDDGGNKAVVAVLLSRGESNALLKTVFAHIPATKGKEETSEITINASDLLPKKVAYYTFPGSLTTPPCSEGVTWYVLKTPNTLSKEELDTFAKLYPHNARPVQPSNDRKVLASH